jgi:hypothetical protein
MKNENVVDGAVLSGVLRHVLVVLPVYLCRWGIYYVNVVLDV